MDAGVHPYMFIAFFYSRVLGVLYNENKEQVSTTTKAKFILLKRVLLSAMTANTRAENATKKRENNQFRATGGRTMYVVVSPHSDMG